MFIFAADKRQFQLNLTTKKRQKDEKVNDDCLHDAVLYSHVC